MDFYKNFRRNSLSQDSLSLQIMIVPLSPSVCKCDITPSPNIKNPNKHVLVNIMDCDVMTQSIIVGDLPQARMILIVPFPTHQQTHPPRSRSSCSLQRRVQGDQKEV